MTHRILSRRITLFWPKQFRYQLVAIFATVTTIAIVAFTFHAADEQTEVITDKYREQANAVSENLANASAQYIIVRDYTSLENLIVKAIKLPGILAIQVLDQHGRLLGDVIQKPNEEIEVLYGGASLTPPTQTQLIEQTDGETIQIWQPVLLNDLVGWVRITYDLLPIQKAKEDLWVDNLIDGVFIVSMCSLLIILLLRRPTRSLMRYTEFAQHLNEHHGSQVRIDNTSTEFASLGRALNQASRSLKRQEKAINQMVSELKRAANMAEHSPNIVFSTTEAGEIVYMNLRAKAVLTEHRLTPDKIFELLPHCFKDIQNSCLQQGCIVNDVESAYDEKNYLWNFKAFDEQRVLNCYAIDITERKHAQENLIRQANYDSLTALPNRVLALDHLDLAIHRAHRECAIVGVMFIDLDRFKTVNDSFGHTIGDQLLNEVASRLLTCVREGDTVARFGGDEYLIILDSFHDIFFAERVAEHAQKVLTKPFIIEGHEFFVGASIGISVYPDDGDNPHVLLRNADTAMYKAKESGRNNFCFFTQELNDKAKKLVKMESCLRRAIDNHQLFVEYQPQISPQSGKIIGAEALVRWRCEELGVVSPLDFIPLAEDTGLINEIGEWVLLQACRDLMQWNQQGHRNLRVAVNVSTRQFQGYHLLNSVKTVLNDTAISPHCLELEITESALLDNSGKITGMLNEFKRMGITLALDDFGTGYSSLSYLKKFPFDVLKIDRSFVRDLAINPEDAALCRTIIAIAKTLGMEVIGEGVETKEQFEFLTNHGVDLIQGYYYSKPLCVEAFNSFLTERKHHDKNMGVAID